MTSSPGWRRRVCRSRPLRHFPIISSTPGVDHGIRKERRGVGRLTISPWAYPAACCPLIEDAQVPLPRADLGSALPRHHFGDLPQVIEVMGNPCREKLPERHRSKLRVDTCLVEIGFRDLQGTEPVDGLLPQVGEGLEELLKGSFLAFGEHREWIKGPDRDGLRDW